MKPKYVAFWPELLDEHTVIGVERMEHMWDDLTQLLKRHYNETETSYLSEPYDPDVERYKMTEAVGQSVIFTLRIRGLMVGYLMFNVYRGLHSRNTLQAREFAFFIDEPYRGSGYGAKLLTYAEDILKRLGCKHVGMSSKAPVGAPDIGPALEKRGYKPIAVYYVKRLES